MSVFKLKSVVIFDKLINNCGRNNFSFCFFLGNGLKTKDFGRNRFGDNILSFMLAKKSRSGFLKVLDLERAQFI